MYIFATWFVALKFEASITTKHLQLQKGTRSVRKSTVVTCERPVANYRMH